MTITTAIDQELLVRSPMGALHITVRDGAVTAVLAAEELAAIAAGDDEPGADGVLGVARDELRAYFAGELREFTVPVAPAGTAFQRRVWDELRRIPYGEAISYGELARRVGRAGAARAVGAANSRNPVSVIVPCHRVIGGDGRLVGYAGGLDRKRWLLDHEARSTGRRLV
jgi:methylated-DNA-[protein]-cysteine S-methyltransferase